jgi:hypothetical protein
VNWALWAHPVRAAYRDLDSQRELRPRRCSVELQMLDSNESAVVLLHRSEYIELGFDKRDRTGNPVFG